METFEPISYYLKTSPKNTALYWIVKEISLSFMAVFNILLKLVVNPIVHQVKPDLLYLIPLAQIPLLWLLTG